MSREEEERKQAEFNRKADFWLRDGCLHGCIPVIALILLPTLLLVL